MDQRDPSVNDRLADQIQKEWLFRLKRFPVNTATRVGGVRLVLSLLELALIVSNMVGPLGYWAYFVQTSQSYRDSFNQAVYDRSNGRVDFTLINSYSLWRGFVIPVLLGWAGYGITAMICLRHELYHWKPEILLHYYNMVVRDSRWGSLLPERWWRFCFQVYEKKHVEHASVQIQPDRKHVALKDLVEFRRLLGQVGTNLLVSIPAILVMWVILLQTNMETRHILQLPASYVPPVQGLVWYLINDLFYFYPHWIAHSPSFANPETLIPAPFRPMIHFLHKHFKQSHRLHHRCKANIGIAAWYCSVPEQLIFNLFPALIGPIITQLLADAFDVHRVWGTHLVTLYVWILAATSSSVIAHTGYRSVWHDPGAHDLHHERAFDPKAACNFGTLGVFDWLHGTRSTAPAEETRAWRGQQDRKAALEEAERRSGVRLTDKQRAVVVQLEYGEEWVAKDADDTK